jgi:exodeoxyribonuclease VII small subunit
MAKERKQQAGSFEELYARLEEAVAKLEQGGLTLEESIALYEEGMALARQCQERLDDAELRITTLRESFANLTGRANRVQEEPEYEYAAEGEPHADDEQD